MGYTGEQHAAYELARYHKRMAKAILQLGGQCVKCGTANNLQIDHIDPTTKSFTISQRMVSQEKLDLELAKCQLLCESCHRNKTNRDRRQGQEFRQHGTWAMYKRGKCRCSQCKEFFNQYRAEWRRRTGRTTGQRRSKRSEMV